MDFPDRNAFNVLSRLNGLIDKAQVLYQDYLAAGKTFAYARKLRAINEQIQVLVSDDSALLPATLRQDALALLPHIQVWMQKWLELERELKPGDDTVFVFENDVRFNKEAAARLKEAERWPGAGKDDN